jgi:hypothetical protein
MLDAAHTIQCKFDVPMNIECFTRLTKFSDHFVRRSPECLPTRSSTTSWERETPFPSVDSLANGYMALCRLCGEFPFTVWALGAIIVLDLILR